MKWPWVSRLAYDEAVRRARVAEDRLYAAWKEGHTIPPREAVEPPPAKVIELLPEKLTGYINNWEDATTRADLEREARRLTEQGFSEERVIELWSARTGHSNGDGGVD